MWWFTSNLKILTKLFKLSFNHLLKHFKVYPT